MDAKISHIINAEATIKEKIAWIISYHVDTGGETCAISDKNFDKLTNALTQLIEQPPPKKSRTPYNKKTLSKKKLVALQKRYKSDSKIGEVLGIKHRAVYRWRKKYGIPTIMYTGNNERDRHIKYLYTEALLSMGKIGDIMGLDESRVSDIIKGVKKDAG